MYVACAWVPVLKPTSMFLQGYDLDGNPVGNLVEEDGLVASGDEDDQADLSLMDGSPTGKGSSKAAPVPGGWGFFGRRQKIGARNEKATTTTKKTMATEGEDHYGPTSSSGDGDGDGGRRSSRSGRRLPLLPAPGHTDLSISAVAGPMGDGEHDVQLMPNPPPVAVADSRRAYYAQVAVMRWLASAGTDPNDPRNADLAELGTCTTNHRNIKPNPRAYRT